MRARLIYVEAYNYYKNNEKKVGRSITVQSLDLVDTDDGCGNLRYGTPTEVIRVLMSVPVSNEALMSMVGEVIEITYTRDIGSRFERIANIALYVPEPIIDESDVSNS